MVLAGVADWKPFSDTEDISTSLGTGGVVRITRVPGFLGRTRTEYVLTGFRVVVKRSHRTVEELALDDIDSVTLTQAWWQRIVGTSTVRVFSGRDGPALEIANIHHGPQLAFVIQLRATELRGEGSRGADAEFFRTLWVRSTLDPAPASGSCARGDTGVRALFRTRAHAPGVAAACDLRGRRSGCAARRSAVD